MKITNKLISKGFILSGLMNIFGVLIFSKFFNNAVINEFDNQTMSNFGLLMIVIWGFAFIAVAKNYDKVKWLIGVFVLEKLIYAIHWTSWINHNELTKVFDKDKMAGVFYTIYGINDWLFFLFFLIVFSKLMRKGKTIKLSE